MSDVTAGPHPISEISRVETTTEKFAKKRLSEWLASHTNNLQRFAQLIPLSTVADEVGLDADTIRIMVSTAEPAIYHVWPHTHAGKTRATKPYCLRLAGQDSICLDWEDSVVAAAEAEFRRLGYVTCQELGTDDHLKCLIEDPNVSLMTAGVNLRDLWAQRYDGENIDFWIVEAKGKEAGGFGRYCFAEALSQLFEIPAQLLSALLGTRRKAGHGLCSKFADQLLNGWQERGWHANIRLAILVPLWSSDVIWDSGRPKPRFQPYYQRAYEEFVEFIERGTSRASSSKRGEAVFGQILEGLESQYSLRALSRSNSGLCFRVLTTRAATATGEFMLHGFPAERQ
jgi:hypothetical protein